MALGSAIVVLGLEHEGEGTPEGLCGAFFGGPKAAPELDEGVVFPFVCEGAWVCVTWVDGGAVGEGHQNFHDGVLEIFESGVSGAHGSPDTATKEGVPSEEGVSAGIASGGLDEKGHLPLGVAWDEQALDLECAQGQAVSVP